MNLGELRLRVLEHLDWQPTQDSTFVAKANRFIERAHQALFNEAPFLYESRATFVTQPDVNNTTGDINDRVRVNVGDAYVMERNGTLIGADAATWAFNRTWDGRFVEITDPNGQLHRRQTREWWTDIDPGSGDTLHRFSIDTPWPNTTDTGMVYRVFTPEYHLPADVVEIRSAKPYTDPNHLLNVVSQYDGERYRLIDYRGDALGLPEVIMRGKPFWIDAPTRAPDVATAGPGGGGGLWTGPDNAGAFEYVYTYVWGDIDPDVVTPHGLTEVRWESGPSPASVVITTTNGGDLIRLTMPDADFQLNFNIAGTVRETRSGFRKRIYARRSTSALGGGITRTIESPNVFMLVGEVAGNVETFDHAGAVGQLLDYNRRLKHIHGYQSVRLFPMPDRRYEIDCRVLRRPNPLANDQDTPLIHEDAMEAFIYRCLMLFYEYDGKPELSALSEQRYREQLQVLRKRYGQFSYYHARKRPARVRKIRHMDRSRIVTYSEPT